jgi:hypothetical protein
MKIKPKRYIVWSKEEIDLDDPFLRKWYIQEVLIRGRTEDIREIDLEEVKRILPDLKLPKHIRSLWNDYFAGFKQDSSS